MTDNNAPRMPLAASSNMAMSMSTASSISQKSRDIAINPPMPTKDALKAIATQSHSTLSKDSEHSATTLPPQASTGGQLMMDVQRDRTSSREKAFNIQRIQLAEQLSKKHKLCIDLEARISSLQDELASLTSSNKAFEVECVMLHRQINEAAQKLESQTADAGQRDKAMLERVSDLETKLDEAVKSLDQSILSRDILQRAHDEAVKLEKSHESRQHDLQQRLTLKGVEVKELKREIGTLRTACADAVEKKEALQKKLHTQAEDHRVQALQEKQQLEEARDQSLAESRKLRQSLDKLEKSLEKSAKPFAQTVVICVDVSGSLTSFIHEIKQAYRDVLHIVKSVNSDARVAVVIHGGRERHNPSPVQAISDATFRIMDDLDSMGGAEDYTYCLEQANNIFRMNIDSQKLLVLIGDGNATCSSTTSLFVTCEQLMSARISTYSIVIASHSPFDGCTDLTMQGILEATGSRVEYKDTYLSALDELLRHEREQHFEASHLY
ncbi:hypothetical protein F5X99DRAFT_428229 [Biscogniauxia marginata]|nr:hypothetical protein F5X99DRAFT_428229 [Biscogniauxia marginata]